jgi:hypothetical protein
MSGVEQTEDVGLKDVGLKDVVEELKEITKWLKRYELWRIRQGGKFGVRDKKSYHWDFDGKEVADPP